MRKSGAGGTAHVHTCVHMVLPAGRVGRALTVAQSDAEEAGAVLIGLCWDGEMEGQGSWQPRTWC